MKKTIYLDMDGTLAMFYSDHACLEKMYEPGYFKFLSPYVKFLMAVKMAIKEGMKFKIISACVTDICMQEKDIWLDTFLPEIGSNDRIFCRIGENKATKISEPIGDTVLIDDYSKNCNEWDQLGGTAIKFLNEINGKGESWKGFRINYDSEPEEFLEVFRSIV